MSSCLDAREAIRGSASPSRKPLLARTSTHRYKELCELEREERGTRRATNHSTRAPTHPHTKQQQQRNDDDNDKHHSPYQQIQYVSKLVLSFSFSFSPSCKMRVHGFYGHHRCSHQQPRPVSPSTHSNLLVECAHGLPPSATAPSLIKRTETSALGV